MSLTAQKGIQLPKSVQSNFSSPHVPKRKSATNEEIEACRLENFNRVDGLVMTLEKFRPSFEAILHNDGN
jgi:hypothetical protein